MNVTQFTISLPDDHLAAVHQLAAELGIDRSQVIEKAVRMYHLAHWQAKSAAPQPKETK